MATTSLAAHFALQNTASNSAEKKNRPSEGVAEGGGGGNSARVAGEPMTSFPNWRRGRDSNPRVP